jgi:hypothetical protein
MRDHFAAIRAKHPSSPEMAGNPGNRRVGSKAEQGFSCFPSLFPCSEREGNRDALFPSAP